MPGGSVWSWIKPNMTFRLLLITFFLAMIALGNLIAVYENFNQNNSKDAVLYLVAALTYAIPAYGIFNLKRWARMAEIIFSSIMLVLGIIMLLFSFGTGILAITLHGLIVACLLSTESRKAFGL